MPATLTERPPAPAAQYPLRRRWTRAECERAEAAGIFDQQHLELIEGELIDKKMSKNRPHVSAAALLVAWLLRVFGDRRVNHEAPIDVAPEDNPRNQPVPDLIVLTSEYAESDRSWTATPQPRDLDLVVEIADTSLLFDLTVKASLYARAGIAEYWILDVIGRRLIVHRNQEAGQYASVVSYADQESVAPLAAPQSSFLVRDAFPE
jgi:Uma2 family endonuclease